jgi:hypothetical protein
VFEGVYAAYEGLMTPEEHATQTEHQPVDFSSQKTDCAN